MRQALIYDSPEYDIQDDLTLYGDTDIPPAIEPVSPYPTEEEVIEQWDYQSRIDSRKAKRLAKELGLTYTPIPNFSWRNIEPRTTFDFLMVRARSNHFAEQLAEHHRIFQSKSE
jgi:hypothetical protein